MTCFYTVETPKGAAGAIAMIRVVHPDPSAIGLANPQLNKIKLAKLFDIDEGVVTRFDDESVVLMPHGGMAIVRLISAELENRGVVYRDDCFVFPEAESEIESMMLGCMSKAMSPLAVDLLLDQPELWKAAGVETLLQADAHEDGCNGESLARLIEPPIVAAVGRANIGKSTLINALAGEHVAIVADVAGTTRDHVGVLVDLGGLVVRWIDTPGIDVREGADEDAKEVEAVEIAMRVVAQAQLVVHCIDPADDVGQLDQRIEQVIGDDALRIRVGTRADLGQHGVPIDVCVSVQSDSAADSRFDGGSELVSMIREQLVPACMLEDARPWRFWDASGA